MVAHVRSGLKEDVGTVDEPLWVAIARTLKCFDAYITKVVPWTQVVGIALLRPRKSARGIGADVLSLINALSSGGQEQEV